MPPSATRIPPVEMTIFPDSGASICFAGPQHITK